MTEGGERGVAFGEPQWENPAKPKQIMRWDGALFTLVLRREGGSNPRSRDSGTTVFETAAFDHSAISPIL